MDRKDFQLLVGLYENARQSYRALARRVSLSAPAVRERLRRLESRGILQGYMLSIDPSVFDRDDLLVFFRGRWTRGDATKALAARDVAWVSWKLDGSLTVGVWSRDSATAAKNLADDFGATPSGQALTRHRAPSFRLSLVDLSIIDSLIDEPRMPLKDILVATGLSPKTVRNHLEFLFQSQVVFIEPRLGTFADSGELVYQLAIFGRIDMTGLLRILGDAYLVNETQEPPAKSLLCLGGHLGDVMTKTHAVEELPGVESVNLSLNREMLVATEFIHSLVRERTRDLRRAR
jgi:DNA-binding Lrp family transcriptional regulator